MSEDNDSEMREIWADYNSRQEFEHDLLNRKTTWLLTTQALLFTAYGVTFGAPSSEATLETFRKVAAWLGLVLALVTFVGVVFILNSKRLSWKEYSTFFDNPDNPGPPRPLAGARLQWGVNTKNTWFTLIPDAAFPLVFVIAWTFLLVDLHFGWPSDAVALHGLW